MKLVVLKNIAIVETKNIYAKNCVVMISFRKEMCSHGALHKINCRQR
jgi:hypothetical protein